MFLTTLLFEILGTFMELLCDLMVLFLDLVCFIGVLLMLLMMVAPLVICFGPVVMMALQ